MDLNRKNKKTLHSLLFLVLVMVLFAVALIPLYDILCEITGINGKIKKTSTDLNYVVDTRREIAFEFIASAASGTHLDVKADEYEIKVHPGGVINIGYTVTNKTSKRMLTRANPSITPGPSVRYVKNTECFCFENQVFEGGETKHLEVQLVVDSALPERYKRIAFGLTFFDITNK
ncbi:MAG: cytochrome c oxidase assembly protein [Methyloprofundus sp.]|nr:cytochrome c oxidase assembly protein [Methyloprofundus sp.]MBW6453054.1 cytochrome c oxidase assembly protein [Methyloprofundus sp.]